MESTQFMWPLNDGSEDENVLFEAPTSALRAASSSRRGVNDPKSSSQAASSSSQGFWDLDIDQETLIATTVVVQQQSL